MSSQLDLPYLFLLIFTPFSRPSSHPSPRFANVRRPFCLSSRETIHLSDNLWQPSSRVYFEKRENYQRELKSTKEKINFTQESLFFLIFSEKVRIDISSFRFYTFFALKIKQTLSILLPGQRTELSPRYHVPSSTIILSSSSSLFEEEEEKEARTRVQVQPPRGTEAKRGENGHCPASLKGIEITNVIPPLPRGRASTNRDACTRFDRSHAWTDVVGARIERGLTRPSLRVKVSVGFHEGDRRFNWRKEISRTRIKHST